MEKQGDKYTLKINPPKIKSAAPLITWGNNQDFTSQSFFDNDTKKHDYSDIAKHLLTLLD